MFQFFKRMSLQPFGPWPLFQFLNLYTVGRTHWTWDQPVARSPFRHRKTQTQNKSTQISMLRVGFEPTIPEFKWAKTVHALECAVTVIGLRILIALPAHSGPWPHIQFPNHFTQTVGPLGREIRPSQGRYLKTGQQKHRINAYTPQTRMS
jgi:hypothetical protein